MVTALYYVTDMPMGQIQARRKEWLRTLGLKTTLFS
jgi:hypothetical protein